MISIAYITMRRDNQLDWMWKGLLKQKQSFPEIPIQFMYVDYWKEERQFDFSNDLGIEVLHTLPLPSPWQGKYQVTKEVWYACANARNTAFVYAIHPTIAFCDDLTVLGSDWLQAVVEAAHSKYIALGAYEKRHDMVVENGVLVSGRLEADGVDARMKYHRQDKTQVSGDLFYGCSAAMPLESALRINGFDCLTDSIGYEDGIFGIRLERDGNKFFYDKRLFTVESNDHPQKDFTVKRVDKMLGEEKYMQALNKLGIQRTTFSEPFNKDCSHILIDVARQKTKAVWNFHSLRELRSKREAGKELTLEDMKYPLTTWFDDTPLQNDEMILDKR